jgi:hypothetical protein
MAKLMEPLYKNEIWYLVEIPNGRKTFGRKWVFKKKLNATCQVKKFKDQLIEKGYAHVEGVDFCEIFSPVEKITSTRALMSLALSFNIEIEKLDVKTMF